MCSVFHLSHLFFLNPIFAPWLWQIDLIPLMPPFFWVCYWFVNATARRECPKGAGATLIRPDAFSVPAVHGVWEEWSPWSLCSFTCGRGHRTRTRMCAPPQHGGRACDGPETQTKLCNIALCPGIVSSALTISSFFAEYKAEIIAERINFHPWARDSLTTVALIGTT